MGNDVHDAYETKMVFDHRQAILDGLKQTPAVKAGELVTTGFDAARLTIGLMRATFELIPPKNLVDAFVAAGGKSNKTSLAALWEGFGRDTIKSMQGGAHLIAQLWESAWVAGGGDSNVKDPGALSHEDAMAIVTPADFLPSMTVGKIGAALKNRPAQA